MEVLQERPQIGRGSLRHCVDDRDDAAGPNRLAHSAEQKADLGRGLEVADVRKHSDVEPRGRQSDVAPVTGQRPEAPVEPGGAGVHARPLEDGRSIDRRQGRLEGRGGDGESPNAGSCTDVQDRSAGRHQVARGQRPPSSRAAARISRPSCSVPAA